MREPMSENWQLIKQDIFYLYKAKDNSYICTAYVERPTHTLLTMRSCFIRDLNFITGPLSKYKWCPEFGKEDRDGWRVYLRFGGHFCQDIFDRNETLDQYCPDWKEQLTQMCMDFRTEQLYKISMNPAYFFIDEEQNLKTFGFFNSFSYGEQPVAVEILMPVFTAQEAQFMYPRTELGRFDFKHMEEYVYKNSHWPNGILSEIYSKMYAVNGQDSQI